jgi:hypothetical protein
MKIKTISRNASILAVAIASACTLSTQAATPSANATALAVGNQPIQFERVAAHEDDLLRDAYHSLSKADGDYHGHRAKAMKEIEAAAGLLGSDVHGAPGGGEFQGASDAHLRHSRELLQQARDILIGRDEHRALKHVKAAIEELNVALDIK